MMADISLGVITLYELLAYFFIYSFLGWVVEVAFHAITMGKFVNRGFLNGPVCPIYGTGVALILLILQSWVEKFWVVFLVGVALPTLIELITGWALETFFHNKWWDYSTRKFNFKGYICLEFSLLWGVAVLFAIEGVHPAVVWLFGKLPYLAGSIFIYVCCAFMIVDLVITVSQVLKLNQKLKEIDEAAKAMRLGSDFIGEKVASATLTVEEKVLTAKEKLEEKKENAQASYLEWKKKREQKIDEIVAKMPKRLLKAFPKLQSRNAPESVDLARESVERKKRKRYKK